MTVRIEGSGIAACCCARLLSAPLSPANPSKPSRQSVPALLLNPSSQALLSDVFQDGRLFEGAHRIQQRIVCWGRESGPVVLPHDALVLPESVLLQRIQSKLKNIQIPNATGKQDTTPERADTVLWSVLSSSRNSTTISHNFGTRLAWATEVTLKPVAPSDACWIESVPGGWLFLLSCGPRRAWLLSIGQSADALLPESRLIAHQVEHSLSGLGPFPAHPRMTFPLLGESWITCGTAAVAFDPVCGEGAGHAVREAVLASAVLRRVINTGERNPLMSHYSNRILSGFLRHLRSCEPFYAAMQEFDWWREELKSLRNGMEWCTDQLRTHFPAYRLSGFELLPL